MSHDGSYSGFCTIGLHYFIWDPVFKCVWNLLNSAKIYTVCDFQLSKGKNCPVGTLYSCPTVGHLVRGQQARKPQTIRRQVRSSACKRKTNPEFSLNVNLGKISWGEFMGQKVWGQETGKLWCWLGCLSEGYLVKQRQVTPLCRVPGAWGHAGGHGGPSSLAWFPLIRRWPTTFYLHRAIASDESLTDIIDLPAASATLQIVSFSGRQSHFFIASMYLRYKF